MRDVAVQPRYAGAAVRGLSRVRGLRSVSRQGRCRRETRRVRDGPRWGHLSAVRWHRYLPGLLRFRVGSAASRTEQHRGGRKMTRQMMKTFPFTPDALRGAAPVVGRDDRPADHDVPLRIRFDLQSRRGGLQPGREDARGRLLRQQSPALGCHRRDGNGGPEEVARWERVEFVVPALRQKGVSAFVRSSRTPRLESRPWGFCVEFPCSDY